MDDGIPLYVRDSISDASIPLYGIQPEETIQSLCSKIEEQLRSINLEISFGGHALDKHDEQTIADLGIGPESTLHARHLSMGELLNGLIADGSKELMEWPVPFDTDRDNAYYCRLPGIGCDASSQLTTLSLQQTGCSINWFACNTLQTLELRNSFFDIGDTLTIPDYPQLQTLKLIDLFGVESLELGRYPQLKTLHISVNHHLCDFQFHHNYSQLLELEMVGNDEQLQSIAFNDFPNLKRLTIRGNAIQHLHLPHFPSLQELSIGSHQDLESIVFDADYYGELQSLIIDQNKELRSVELKEFPKLHTLIVDDNPRLNALQLGNYSRLDDIKVRRNGRGTPKISCLGDLADYRMYLEPQHKKSMCSIQRRLMAVEPAVMLQSSIEAQDDEFAASIVPNMFCVVSLFVVVLLFFVMRKRFHVKM